MTDRWPSFVTADLGDSEKDDAEMTRRWETYNREMQALIARGGVHLDEDGWWVDDATGELIGPDPELERPSTDEELAQARPFKEALPDLYENIQRSRGRRNVTASLGSSLFGLPRSVIERWQRDPDWRAKMAETLEKAV